MRFLVLSFPLKIEKLLSFVLDSIERPSQNLPSTVSTRSILSGENVAIVRIPSGA